MKKIFSLFLAILMIATAGIAFAEEAATEEETPIVYGPKIAADMFTVHDDFQTYTEQYMEQGMTEEEAHAETVRVMLREIAAYGYDGYQMSRWFDWQDISAEELGALNEELGLEMIAPHWGICLRWTDEEWEYWLNYLSIAGATGICQDLNFPSGGRSRESGYNFQSDLKAWADKTIADLQLMRDKLDQFGYSDWYVAYHPHSWDIVPIDAYYGRNMLEIIYYAFDGAVVADIDTAWDSMGQGGIDAIQPYTPIGEEAFMEYVKTRGEYFKWMHLQDADWEGVHTTPIGQGDLEWDELFTYFQIYDVEWVIVEDNHPGMTNRTSLESFETSIKYIDELYKTLGFTRQ